MLLINSSSSSAFLNLNERSHNRHRELHERGQVVKSITNAMFDLTLVEQGLLLDRVGRFVFVLSVLCVLCVLCKSSSVRGRSARSGCTTVSHWATKFAINQAVYHNSVTLSAHPRGDDSSVQHTQKIFTRRWLAGRCALTDYFLGAWSRLPELFVRR